MAKTSTASATVQKRKAHNKSRHGCRQCKRRHAKCDEVHPRCGTCDRLQDECSFSAPAPDSLLEPMDQHLFTINDMRLLHKCLQEGPLFDDQGADTAKASQDHVMELALSHQYLLHSKLSLAAIDLFHHDPANISNYKQATAHDVAALKDARPNISRCGYGHSEAMYMFSALTALFAYAEPPLRLLSPEHAHTVDPIASLLDAFRLHRGIHTVMSANEEHLGESRRRNAEQWHDQRSLVADAVEYDYPQLGKLQDLIDRHCVPDQVAVVQKALRDLFETIALLAKKPLDDSSAHLIQVWPMHVDAIFIDMLARKDPVALVMLAHYAVMVNMRRNIWFFQRWPAILLRALYKELGEKWHEHLAWPEQMIAAG